MVAQSDVFDLFWQCERFYMTHVDYQNRVDYRRHLCGCWQCSTRDGTAQKCLPWRQTAFMALAKRSV
jgi:hypothetical protein